VNARRWTRYTLRSVMLLILVCAVLFTWIRIRIEAGRRQKEAVAALRDSGASVHYDYEYDAAKKRTKQRHASAPKWVRSAVGDDTLAKLDVVEHLGGTEEEMESGLSQLPKLRSLGRLYLGGSKVTDKQLLYIGQVADLRELYLEYTQIRIFRPKRAPDWVVAKERDMVSACWVRVRQVRSTNMSQSLLYHTFRIRGYRLKKTEFDGGNTLFHVTPQRSSLCCSECGVDNVIRRGETTRWFRNLPVGGRVTWLIATIPRVECHECGVCRQIKTGFSEPRRTYTRAFARYALELSRHMTIKDVADHLCVSWDIIKDIQKRHLLRHYSRPSLKDVRQIAIDEISIGSGHRYLTIVLDLETGAVLFVGDGKGAESLISFWRRLRRLKGNIEAVAIDMSAAYIAAVSEHLPDAMIVFDRFHIVKLMNEKLTQLRRDLHREAVEGLSKQVLKGTRWLLLKHPDNLREDRRESERLQEALELNESLAIAYYLKEDLRQIWEQESKSQAERFLRDWIARARSSGIRALKDMASTLERHAWGITSWYDYPISTGPLEGTNNKIKTMQRQHYGLRDAEFRKLKIYALHETKYALVG
jgi:transposase